MRRRQASFLFAVILIGAAAVAAAWLNPDDEFLGRARVMDGDSLTINGTIIRLEGIDAPEGNQTYGPEAAQALRRLIAGRDVRCLSSSMDQYDRELATCYLRGDININREMVRRGHAWDYAWLPFGGYAGEEHEARKASRGLWRETAPTPPWEWRKLN